MMGFVRKNVISDMQDIIRGLRGSFSDSTI